MGENWLYNLTDKPGVKVWRIDNKSQQLSKEQFGLTATLKSDDCYVVLQATLDINGGPNTYKCFGWIGSTTSQEEYCNAKIKELQDALLPCPCPQTREVQAEESKEFKSFFRGGIKYVEPLVLKQQTNVRDDAFTNRLYQLKGRRVPVCFLVELSAKSLNSGDVFILDCDHKIFQWNGNSASRMEKGKALDLTTRLRDERMNRLKAEIIVQREGAETEEFWKLLGGKVDVMNEKDLSITTVKTVRLIISGRDDDEIEQWALTHIKLFQLLDDNGVISITLYDNKEKRLDRSDLNPDLSYLLDTGNAVFVWNGRNTTIKKELATDFANQYMKTNNKPAYASLTFVAMGVEPALFRTHFTGKFTEYIDTPEAFEDRTKKKFSKVAGSIRQEKVNVDALLHPEKYQIAKEEFAEYIPSAPTVNEHVLHQEFKIFLVQDKKRVDLPQDEYGIFYSGQCYIIQYTVRRDGGTRKFVVYYWQGRDCNREDKGSSGLLATDLSSKFGRGCTMVRVVQNKEPTHLLSHFKGYMVVRKGRRDEWAAKYDNKPMLFQIRGNTELDATAVQVDAFAYSLNSNDSFVLQCDEGIFIWNGKGSSKFFWIEINELGANEFEKKNAQLLSTRVTELQMTKKSLQVFTEEEESESAKFWSALGGKAAYSSAPQLKEGNIKARLFQCNNKTGMFRVFEIFDFTQDDLDDDDIMLLDTYKEIFVWFGAVAKKKQTNVDLSLDVASEYMKLADDGRDNEGAIYLVDAGAEPLQFISYFKGWSEAKAVTGEDIYQRNLELLKKQEGVTLVDLQESGKPNQRRPRVVSVSPVNNTNTNTNTNNNNNTNNNTGSLEDKWKVYNPSGDIVDYDRLKTKPSPDGIDGAHLEAYLSDEEFLTYMKMTRDAFYKLPNWHQLRLKKSVSLF